MKTTSSLTGVFDLDTGRLVGLAPKGSQDVTYLAGQDTAVPANSSPVVSITDPLTGEVENSIGGISFRPTRGNGMVIIGDSRIAQNTNNPSQTNKNAQGVVVWAQALSRKAGFFVTQNLGVSGDRTDQMLARMDAAVADPAGVAFVWCGVNDIAQNYPSATTSGATAFANIATLAKALIASGKHVILTLDTPVTSWDATQRGQLFDLNSRLTSAFSGSRSVSLADFFGVVVDPASATLQPRANYYSDTTHVGIKGAYHCAKVLRDIVDPLLPAALIPLPCGASDVFSLNPNSLLDTGCHITTSGGVAGTGASGTVPAGANVARSSGTGTVAVSTAASPDGVGNDLVLTFTAAAADVFRVAYDITTTRLVAGATYVLEGEVSVTSATGLRAIQCRMEYNGTVSGIIQRNTFEDSIGGAGPDEDFTIRFQSEEFVAPTVAETITWMTLRIMETFNAASSAVVKIRRLRLRRVI